MRALAFFALSVLAGCEDAPPPRVLADLGVDAAPDAAMPSNVVTLTGGMAFSIEYEHNVDGVRVAVDGYPELVSPPSSNYGKLTLQVPKALYDSGAPYLLSFSGGFDALLPTGEMQTVPVRSLLAPARTYRSAEELYLYFLYTSDGPCVRTALANALRDEGVISANDAMSFDDRFLWTYGRLSDQTDQPLVYDLYSVAVDGTTPTAGCNPASTCCVYYAQSYAMWSAATYQRSDPSPFVDVSLTRARRTPDNRWYPYFAVVCPGTGKTEVTLQATGGFDSSVGNPPKRPFPDITVPMRHGTTTYTEWTNN